MSYQLISLLPLQIARMLLLVRSIEVIRVKNHGPRQWAILIQGRGFTKILRDEPLLGRTLIPTDGWRRPKPILFASASAAKTYGESTGLFAKALSPVDGRSS